MNVNADPTTYKKSLGFLFNYLVNRKLKHLRKYVKKSETGYDIGAGFGQYAERMNELGYHVIAIEPDERFIRQCKTRHCVGSGENLTSKRDYAYLFNVLHHSDAPIGLTRHLSRITNKIIISELNRCNLFVWLYVKLFIRHERIDHHYSRKDVLAILSGLNVEKTFTTSLLGIPFVYNWFIITSQTGKDKQRGRS